MWKFLLKIAIIRYSLVIFIFTGENMIKVIAPMAGITDSNFALKVIPYGFDVFTLGGYNTDYKTVTAGEKILKRGRSEFIIPLEELYSYIENEINIIKNRHPEIKISVNLRATSPDSIIAISKINNLDIIEINAHCRQKEFLDIGCGQNMLNDLNNLNDFVSEVVKKVKSNQKVSVKVRANVKNVDNLIVAKEIENSGADYIHIDAMKPGVPNADFDLIKKISNETDIFIIGNNSIMDIESGKRMIDAGASGISIARALIDGKLNFDISKI